MVKARRATKLCLILLFAGYAHTVNSQVIISLLLGDKLNSGKVEFGLDGGVNFITQPGSQGKSRSAFNLGFYFDIKMKNSWMIHTGVIVKSTLGANGLPVYSLNIPDLDTIYAEGSINRTMQYFHVPVLLKHAFQNNFYIEAGPQLGLLYKATDQFRQTINGADLTYDVDVRDKFYRLDAGLTTGLGYRLMGGNGMNLGVRYYLGLANVAKEGQRLSNQSLYITLGIPIGAGKAKAREEKTDSQK